MTTPRISIAMATYNGGSYLVEQLESLATQERLPDELIVSDDGSCDDTVAVVRAFAERAPFDVMITRNEQNLGYAANFQAAIDRSTGDIIFLSDQDDVWLPRKLARVIDEFARDAQTLLIMTDAAIVHADGVPTGLTKLGQTLSLGLGEDAFTTGCCMAFRRELMPFASPVPSHIVPHDVWINQLAVRLGAKRVVAEVHQQYRRHGDNTSDWIASRTEKVGGRDLLALYRNKSSYAACRDRLKKLDALELRLSQIADAGELDTRMGRRTQVAIVDVARERRAIIERMAVLERPRRRRLVGSLRLAAAGGYGYFSGWRSMMKDLLQ